MRPSGKISIEVYESADSALPDLRRDWDACLDALPPEQQLFSFDWYQAWLATYGAERPWTGRVVTLIARDGNGKMLGGLPLAERKQKGLTILSLGGLYQPVRSFPCSPEHVNRVCEGFISTLVSTPGWDILRLGPFDDATPERAAMLAALANSPLQVVPIPLGRTIVNHLADSVDAYAKTHAMKDMFYYERRFLREGEAEIRHVANPDPAEAAALWRDLQAVEKRSWLVEKGGDLRFGSPMDHEFWSRVTATALTPREQLDVWVAVMNGEPVSFRLVLTAGETSYLVANQYDQRFKKYSTGWILFKHNLEDAIARGTRTIDSAPGDLHYKSRLGGEEAQMRLDLVVLRPTLKGRVLAGGLRGLHGLRDRLGRTEAGKRVAARLPRI